MPFGIREFHFDADQGFFLNGVHHKVNGVALHTDGGAVGTAVPLAVWERRLTELRKLGVNAIRTAHNPPAPEFLDLADRMGFLVMDEMFDCWTVAKNPYDYHLYFKRLVHPRHHRHRDARPQPSQHHPLVRRQRDPRHAQARGRHAHPQGAGRRPSTQNDPTRPVTQALFRPNASHDYDDGLADLLDVVGQNYREQEILAAHAQKPTRKIIGTENSARPRPMGRHARPPRVLRPVPVVRHRLPRRVAHAGPRIGSGSGLLNCVALPHGRAFERQSWWSTTPMVAMVRRVAVVRAAPVDPGYANATSIDQSAAPATPAQPLGSPARRPRCNAAARSLGALL